MRPYYAPGGLSAAYYDVVTAADAQLSGDIAIYAGLAPPPGPVLELGVGSGRVAAALAAGGYDVTGVDISEPMLAQAEARRAALPAAAAQRITLVKGDIVAPPAPGAYALVACTFFTLAHLPAGPLWAKVFASAAERLAAGGLAAFHLPKAALMRKAGGPPPQGPVMIQPLYEGRRLVLFVRERGYSEQSQQLDQVLEYVVIDAEGRPLRRSLERLTYWMADPLPFAEAAGLVLDRQAVDVGGVGDIWVFRKA